MSHGTCSSCTTPLLQPEGFHLTGLCGPCCTGEADTLGQVTHHCVHATCEGAAEVPEGTPLGICHECRAPMKLSGA